MVAISYVHADSYCVVGYLQAQEEGEGEGDRTLVEESEGTSPIPSRTPTPDEDIDEVRMMSALHHEIAIYSSTCTLAN